MKCLCVIVLQIICLIRCRASFFFFFFFQNGNKSVHVNEVCRRWSWFDCSRRRNVICELNIQQHSRPLLVERAPLCERDSSRPGTSVWRWEGGLKVSMHALQRMWHYTCMTVATVTFVYHKHRRQMLWTLTQSWAVLFSFTMRRRVHQPPLSIKLYTCGSVCVLLQFLWEAVY